MAIILKKRKKLMNNISLNKIYKIYNIILK